MDKRYSQIKVNYLGLLIVLIFYGGHLKAEKHQLLRLLNPNESKIEIILRAGISLDHSFYSEKLGYLEFVATVKESKILYTENLNIKIIIKDLTQHYKSISIPYQERTFPLGSMQGNYTYSEMIDRYENLRLQYPSILSSRIVIGSSYEGNDIWAFKLSDNPSIDEQEPKVLYTSLTHAREPLGMMNLFYFVQKMCETYLQDAESNFIIDNRELWFIPVVNPDGYLYNEFIEPSGGGMHRKNRRDTGCDNGTSRGVDLNRNFSYGWGTNNVGSSPDPCSETYRGSNPFSEPETQTIKDFINSKSFSSVLHYHSYGNFLLHPFGDASVPVEPDLTTFLTIGEKMTNYNDYLLGTGNQTVGYTVNGDAVDWTYGEKGLIAYTPEVGNSFWPSENQVETICEDQYFPNKVFASMAGSELANAQNIIGDFYPDGLINIFDIIQISEFIQSETVLNSYHLNFCDMDNNGLINIFDLVLLINKVLY